MRKIYLDSKPRLEAEKILREKVVFNQRSETVSIIEALGRVTAEPVLAQASLPGFLAAAMDGIAVIAAETFGASDQKPLRLQIGTQYETVDTGDAIPEGYDAVIKVEDIQPISDRYLEILAPAAPGHPAPTGPGPAKGDHFLNPGELISFHKVMTI
jgi:putative molybdopterin biosynthesis protein